MSRFQNKVSYQIRAEEKSTVEFCPRQVPVSEAVSKPTR